MIALVTTQNIDQPIAFIGMVIAIGVLIFGCILAAMDKNDPWNKDTKEDSNG